MFQHSPWGHPVENVVSVHVDEARQDRAAGHIHNACALGVDLVGRPYLGDLPVLHEDGPSGSSIVQDLGPVKQRVGFDQQELV